MTTTTAERLMFITASDGLELTGALFGDPAGGDLVVLTHGSADRFCDRAYVDIGRELADRGHALLTGDTRGRDIAAIHEVNGELVAVGAAFERFAASIADVAAWIEEGRRLAPARLVVAGHSMGGSKVVRAMAGSTAAGLLLLSPAVNWAPNGDRIQLAGELVAAGRGAELMPPHPDEPSWNVISVATLHERATLIDGVFGDRDSPWGAVDMPTLVLFGGLEEENDANIELLRAGWSSHHPLTCQVIDGAGHFFQGYATQVADVVTDWMATLA